MFDLTVLRFFGFLLERDVLCKYFCYFTMDDCNFYRFFSYDLERISAECYIEDAFTWDDTAEGYEFWSDLNDSWIEHYRYFCDEYGLDY